MRVIVDDLATARLSPFLENARVVTPVIPGWFSIDSKRLPEATSHNSTDPRASLLLSATNFPFPDGVNRSGGAGIDKPLGVNCFVSRSKKPNRTPRSFLQTNSFPSGV